VKDGAEETPYNFEGVPVLIPERADVPGGYLLTVRSRTIGTGPDAFAAAAEGILRWGVQRGSGFVPLAPLPAEVEVGAVSVFRVPFGPLQPTVTCRVFEVVDDDHSAGFGHGALVGHPQRGWESYIVTHEADNSVRLTIRVVSRPASWWMRAAGPFGILALHLLLSRNLRALSLE
jgi:uncharacterized protein (UPF0548 family)